MKKFQLITSVHLPCAPEFAVGFGEVFQFWLCYHLWDSWMNHEPRFYLVCVGMPKLLFIRRQSFKDLIRHDILNA